MPNTPNNRKIITLATLSEFKTLFTEQLINSFIPYYGAVASINLGKNIYITESSYINGNYGNEGYFEARVVDTEGVRYGYAQYRHHSVVIEDITQLNSKVINFPNAEDLYNRNTFATQEWTTTQLGSYLPLTGGTISNENPIYFGNVYHSIRYVAQNNSHGAGLQLEGTNIFLNATSGVSITADVSLGIHGINGGYSRFSNIGIKNNQDSDFDSMSFVDNVIIVYDDAETNETLVEIPVTGSDEVFAYHSWVQNQGYFLSTGGTITGNVIIQGDVSRSLSVKRGTSQQGDGEVVIKTTMISGGAEGIIEITDRQDNTTQYRANGIYPNGSSYCLTFPYLSNADDTLATQGWVQNQGYSTLALVSSGGNNGTATTAARSDHRHANAVAHDLENGIEGSDGFLSASDKTFIDSLSNGSFVLGVHTFNFSSVPGTIAFTTIPPHGGPVHHLLSLPRSGSTLTTEEWVQNQGYTTNTGTVTSVTIGVGTGLAIDDASAITTSGTRTISIASGYKLPTTDEWNAKANSADLGTAAFVNTGTSQGNVPVLGVGGKLSNSVLPAIAITETFVCATQAAMLALDAQTGDVCVRTDLSKTFILQGREPGTLSDWVELATPTTGIVSVNGDTGPLVTFNYLASASKSGQTLTITNNGGGTVSLENTWRPLGTGVNDAAAGDHNHDTRYLQLSGGTMSGNLEFASGLHIQLSTSSSGSMGNYISAGGGYSYNSGKYGVKIAVCDQGDCISGLGQDLNPNGYPYDLCIVGSNSGGDVGHISFVTHKDGNWTTYREIANFYDNAGNVTFTVNGDVKGTSLYENNVALTNKYLQLSGGTLTGKLDIEATLSQPGTMPSLAINYDNNNGGADLGDAGLNMIKFGTVDNYIGQVPPAKSPNGKKSFAFHTSMTTSNDSEFLWMSSGWTAEMTLGEDGLTLYRNKPVRAYQFIENGTALSSKYFGINDLTQQAVTTALNLGTVNNSTGWGTLTAANGYTIRWGSDQPSGGGLVFAEKNGQTSMQVDGEIYVGEGQYRLAHVGEAQPASDVYPWAKASTKPSYNFNEIGGRYESYLTWGGGQSHVGGFGPLDAALVSRLSANRVAGISGEAIEIERSNDGGSTWTTVDRNTISNAARKSFFTTGNWIELKYGSVNQTTDRLRITMNATDYGVYTQIFKLMMLVSTSGSTGCTVYIETAFYSSPTVWHEVGTFDLGGWSGWNVLNFTLPGTGCLGGNNSSEHNKFIRFTFACTGTNETYTDGLAINCMYLFGGVGWSTPSTLAANGVPYNYDEEGNMSVPASIYASALFDNNSRVITAATIGSQSVNYANSAGSVAWGNVSSKPNLITVYRNQSISTATNDYWAAMVNHSDGGSPITPSNDSKWWHILSMDWTGNDPYNWYSQLALPTQDGGVPHYRRNDSGSTHIDNSTWHSFITDENIGSQSVNYATSAGNADTIDNEHASAFAHRGQNNDLIASGNEFNFIPSSYSPDTVWFNYRTADGGFTATGITTYTLGDGKGNALGNIIHTGNIGSQSVNYANSAGAVAWSNVSNHPTDLGDFTNNAGYSKLTLVSSGGNNGSASTAARSDHTHAVAVAETLNSDDVPISGTGSSGFMSAHDKTTIDRLENGFWHAGEWDWPSFSIIDLNDGQIFRRKTVSQPTYAVYETHFMFPQANSNTIETFATEEWVQNRGYTTNQGTVTSVRVQAGTGLTSSQNTAQSGTLDTTISIDSGYKLPTTSEWNSKSSVSGTNDGTNWTSITIDGVTKNIPSGGSSSLTLDNVSDGTTRKLNQVTASTGKAKLGVKTSGVKPHQTGDGYLELSDSSVAHGTTTYFRDRVVYGTNTLVFPTSAGVLALVSNIKHLYKHWVIFNVYSDISFKFEFYSTSTTSSSTLTAANLLQMLQGKIVGSINNNSGSSVMLSVHQAIQANTYQGFIYYVGGSYVEFYPFAVNVTYVTIEDSGYEEV